jgi:hypothetical protein
MADRALQRNARDGSQRAFAEKHNRRLEFQQRDDMRAALGHAPTRRVLMRLLFEARCDVGHLGEENPEFSANTWDLSAKIHYNAGRRGLGLLLMRWIKAADARALLRMAGEELDRTDQLAREIDAAHTPARTEQSA